MQTATMRREPVVAGMFYPAQRERCEAEVACLLHQARKAAPEGRFFAGLVPHAGWTYSGPTAAKTFAALAQSGAPATLVLFGAVHSWGVNRASLFPRGSWGTPLGDLEVDQPLAEEILRQANQEISDNPGAHLEEHSIEVQLPFVKHLFPEARIVPLMVPPVRHPAGVGEIVARAVQPRREEVFLLGSTDLTHYGPRYGFAPRGTGPAALAWAKENDRKLLDAVVQLRAEEVVGLAASDYSACGAGAVAATVAAARALGATRGVLVEHTTSYDAQPMGSPSDFVGYAAVVF
jgi:AmmeMemoRadiSam system protein B